MILKKMRIRQFRNYEDQTLMFDHGIQYITGRNAQGKTNLLEAILYLSTTRSHRVNDDAELIKESRDFFLINGTLEKGNRSIELRIHVSKEGKNLFIYKSPIRKVSDFVGTCNAVMFCPDDLTLFQAAPRVRRRFIDMELSKMSKTYMNALTKANRLLKERNAALKLESINQEYVKVIDDQFLDLQVLIMKQRKKFLDELISCGKNFYEDISQDLSDLAYTYVSAVPYEEDENAVKQSLRKKYEKNWTRDCMMKQTMIGFHKDDVIFTINGKEMSVYASQGQKRSVLLALKLGIVFMNKEVTGEYPILLLDDVFSELDEYRRKKLLEVLPSEVQIFITATDRYSIPEECGKKITDWYVEHGTVKKGAENYGSK